MTHVDAPALAQANVGVAIGSGTAVALQTADVALLSKTSPLVSLLVLRQLSRATLRRIATNFVAAIIYNACLVPIAAGVLYPAGKIRLPPVWSALAMALSSVSVIGLSLLLLLWKPSRAVRNV